ncbi:MAG: hypothetical protein LBE86_15060 [Gemmobacter sp.]|jgi:hypothetical protein|nr:hypothetical protein [Gemmobacter sp.]
MRVSPDQLELSFEDLEVALATATEEHEAAAARTGARPVRAVRGSAPASRRPAVRRTAARAGRPDPELRAFVIARISRMTFPQLAQAVAQTFPKHRRVSQSTIHRCRHREGKFTTRNHLSSPDPR